MSGRLKTKGTRGAVRRGKQYTPKVVTTANAASVGVGGGGSVTTDLSVTGAGGVINRLPASHIIQLAGLSLFGVAGASLADMAAITAALDGQVMRRNGTAIGFGAVDLSNANAIANQLALANLPSIATQTILARSAAGSGVPAALSLSDVLDFISATRGTILYRGAGGWAALAPAVGALVSGGAGTDPAWTAIVSGTGSLLSGTGNPQGAVAAGLASEYQDTATGYIYKKLGGASTAYGWYRDTSPGSPGGANGWEMNPILSTTPAIGSATDFGVLCRGISAQPLATTGTVASSIFITIGTKRYVGMTSSAVSGTAGGVITNAATTYFSLDDDFDLWCDVATGTDVTNIRIWFGITTANISNTDTLASASTGGALLFRFSTVAGDGGWVGYTAKGGGGATHVSATVATIAASTAYRLRIRFVRQGTPTVFFSVNDGTEVAMTADLPVTGASYFLVLGIVPQSALLKQIGWRKWGACVGS